MHSVVLPNMLATMMGLVFVRLGDASAMPQMACAAWVKMVLEMEFSPVMSTMAGIMVMSDVPM